MRGHDFKDSIMKRFLAAALITGLFSTCTLVGCSEETKEKNVSTKEGPGGTEKTTTEVKTEKTGDAKTGEGEAAKPVEAPK